MGTHQNADSRRGFPVPPPALALGALVAQRVLTPSRDGGAGGLRRTAALGLAAGSVALLASANVGFRRAGTTVNPVQVGRSTSLVTTGAHGVTRNPMYLGLAGLLTGHAVWRGSLAALLPVGAFVAVIDSLQVPPEEAAMTELFGDDYARYKERVPRWLPVPGLD